MRLRGLGDLLEIVFRYTGIKFLVGLVSKDCGCDKRRDKINVAIPFEKK
jgi:hypothetical protein